MATRPMIAFSVFVGLRGLVYFFRLKTLPGTLITISFSIDRLKDLTLKPFACSFSGVFNEQSFFVI